MKADGYEVSPIAGRRLWLGAVMALGWPRLAAAAPGDRYAQTTAAMLRARQSEAHVVLHYAEFSRRAQQEGYRGVAYLFKALAAAEQVHAANFGKVLIALEVELPPIAKPALRVGSTRENLMHAAAGEMASIDDFYPQLLAQIQPEGHEMALNMVRWAWATEQKHRDKIRQILRFGGVLFDTVARTIDEKTGRYFVCQGCGSTLNAVPAETCPVCAQAATQYRAIEAPA